MSNNHFINLSYYTRPEIVEDKRKEFVAYGEDNQYFQYLIDRYKGSTTNQAIINGIARMIYGKGLDALDSSRKPNEYVQFKSIFSDECLKKVALDYKMLGMFALEIIYEGGQVKKAEHFPVNTLRPEKIDPEDEDAKIRNWYYHPKWERNTKVDEAEKIPSFGETDGKKTEVYVFCPYISGSCYFSPVDYEGALPYAVLEEEIADYLINDTINGFSGTKVINFNNGVPDEEKQRAIATDITNKITGSKGMKTVISFNQNQESQTTVQDLPLNNAPEHYQYLADECFRKLIVGHGVTSPMLLGIRDGNSGLGNNADEIKNAMLLFDNITIKPKQSDIISVVDEILSWNDISLKLYFRTIQPLEFTDTSGMNAETREEETGVKLSEEDNFSDEEGEALLENLWGEIVDGEWELVDKRAVSDDNEDLKEWANRLIKPKGILNKLASVIKSNPSDSSSLDEDLYKVRYEYAEARPSTNSRDFCRKMMARTARGVVYRKEDIDQASFQGVNKEWGYKRRPYSLWRFKGGKYCHHFWNENLYRRKRKTDGTPYQDKSLSSSKEVQSIAGYNPNPANWDDAKTAPINRPDRGEHPLNRS